jgi:lysophospholipid acyltransferase (LPLAT)-like uncharacterized protein
VGADDRLYILRHLTCRDTLPALSNLNAAIGGWFLAFYAKLIYRTSPFTVEGWENLEAALATKRPIIFASWHGQTHLFYTTFTNYFDISDVYVIMVGDDRQKVLGYFAKYAGALALPVSMDDTSMAAARNLRNIIKKLAPGKFSYISPDGPDGPARVAKPGVAFMARMANALIVPVGSAARRALHIPRWDRYWLPLPFDRIYTVFRPAIEVSRGVPREQVLSKLTDELNRVDEQAMVLAFKRRSHQVSS